MPWNMEMSTMDFKIAFLGDLLNKRYDSFAALCAHYGISPKTGYKFKKRYESNGPDGLKEQSRRPIHSPTKIPEEIENAFVELRKKHKGWGAKKLVPRFIHKYPNWEAPAESTVSNIICRNGLIEPHRRRVHLQHPGKPYSAVNKPNELWGIDFKGEFKTRDGVYCYPLTVTDSHSRYILGCDGFLRPTLEKSQDALTKVFKEYGLPQRIRTDNGQPFSSAVSLGRLSRLSIWWIRLGIFPELIEPASPEQNSRHERMHKTLKAETTRPPAENLKTQQKKFNAFVNEFNNERPHEALGQITPASVHTSSPLSFPSKLPTIYYPSHFEVRRVSHNGGIRWNNKWVWASRPLQEQYIGFEEIDNGIYNVYFSFVLIGRYDEHDTKINTLRSNNKYEFDK
jgi:putative transposase